MNRIELRQQIRDIAAWDTSESDATAVAALNRAIARGYDMAATEAPEAFFPDTERIRIPASVAPSTATVATTADSWVLTFTNFTPTVDGTWNGTFWIEVRSISSSRTLRFQCREFWSTVTGGITSYHVALDRPWPLSSESGMGFTLVAQYVWMPSYWGRVLSVIRYGSTGGPMRLVNYTMSANAGDTRNLTSSLSGPPVELRREQAYQQPAPNRAPVLALTDGTWGDEPTGTFDYCFTYCWGYRDKFDASPSGNTIPLFESSPSPVSSTIAPGVGNNVTVTLPEIDWQLNFNKAGTLRAGHSGVYKRLYRRRSTVTGGAHTTIESPYVFQYLTDVDGATTSFTDDGSIVPDYTLRMPESHSYFGWSMWPTPSEATELDINVLRRPTALDNDYDALMVAPEYAEAIALFCAYWYVQGRDADDNKSAVCLARARQIVMGLRAVHANPTGVISRTGFERTNPRPPLRATNGRL